MTTTNGNGNGNSQEDPEYRAVDEPESTKEQDEHMREETTRLEEYRVEENDRESVEPDSGDQLNDPNDDGDERDA